MLVYPFDSGVLDVYKRQVEESDSEAVYWFSQAAEQEYPRAQFLLGECYDLGFGVEADMALSLIHISITVGTGLAAGTIATGADVLELLKAMRDGASGMFETILVTVLVSAMCALSLIHICTGWPPAAPV